ncbi:MAG: hypothetical protein K2N60_08350 [Oscillospiraceae bacterium]|nr:hypothetical protein [Oscillospiraceae bacterium]
MGFPIITPSFLKELAEKMKPVTADEFCDVNVTATAVEYVPRLCYAETVKKLMEEKNILEYNMISLPDEESEQFINQSRQIIRAYPQAAYYWQLRSLFMNVLQNRNINFEKRLLLLNYGIKTVQGMLDNGRSELIPKFVNDYTSEGMDCEKILEYFKDVRPNPGYSLADGISLLKSLSKPNAAYKEVLNTIYKNLGVSGPETLKMTDMKKYIGMRKTYSEAASGEKAHYIENVMINYVWSYSIPFSNPDFNFWEHFVFFCSLYNAIKVMLACFAPDFSDEEFVKAISAFDNALRASDPNLMTKVILAVKNAGQSNNGDLAILTLS